MKNVSTTFGHLATPATFSLGVRRVQGTDEHYVHVHFPSKDTHFRSIAVSIGPDGAKTFAQAIIKNTKKNNFPFQDQDGNAQFKSFDPNAPRMA